MSQATLSIGPYLLLKVQFQHHFYSPDLLALNRKAGASLLLRVFNRHLFYAIQLQLFRRLLTVALKHSYILGRGLSPPEKEDPEHYTNDHQNHQKDQQEESEHSQHGEETSTKGPAALDLQ
jgi:hypothetical protein